LEQLAKIALCLFNLKNPIKGALKMYFLFTKLADITCGVQLLGKGAKKVYFLSKIDYEPQIFLEKKS